MGDDNLIKFPSRVVAEFGGIVDESCATLCVYGETLEPDELTNLLQTKPTEAFRRGYQRGPRSEPTPHGAWLLEVRGEAPKGPQELIQELLMRLPAESSVWEELNQKYRTRIFVSIHLFNWNRGFSISPDLLGMVAKLGLELDFDIYSDVEDENT